MANAKVAAMKTLSKFPRAVREIAHQIIPMPDGTELSARLWLPKDAAKNPVRLRRVLYACGRGCGCGWVDRWGERVAKGRGWW